MTARSQILDRWDFDVEPSLQAIRDHTEYALQALDDAYTLRSVGYNAEVTKLIADYAVDTAAGAIDLLSNLHGAFLKDADEAGVAGGLFFFDTADLMTAFALWKARSDARRAPLSAAAE